MDKKRHVRYGKFIVNYPEWKDVPYFKQGEIVVLRKTYVHIQPYHNDLGSVQRRMSEVVSLDGRRETRNVIEDEHYIRIKTTPALEVLHGKYLELPPEKPEQEVLHGKGYKYSTKRNRRKP